MLQHIFARFQPVLFACLGRPRLASLLPLLYLLSACGGGGSGSGSSPPPPAAVNQTPTASFSTTPSSGGEPLKVTFSGAASSDSDGQVVTYAWDFGDGTANGVGVVAVHTYTEGSYTVRLTVTDNAGATGSRTGTITVNPPVGTFTVSGSIQILGSSAIDSDVNDINTPAISNNDFDAAQNLPNPVSLGGYINLANTGDAGNLFATGDSADVFKISLTGNELILLTIGDTNTGDLDLRIYDENRTLVNESLGTDNTESLDAPAAGTFFVEVVPFSGASNYVLTVGQNIAPVQKLSLRLSDRFVPGELLLKERQTIQLQAPQAPPSARVPKPAGALNYQAKLRAEIRADLEEKDRIAGVHLMRMKAFSGTRSNTSPGGVPGMAVSNSPERLPQGNYSALQLAKHQTLMAIKTLASEPDIAYVEPNYLRHAMAIPNDPFYTLQWHYPSINLPLAWDITTTDSPSTKAIVAVVDTGVLLNHPDMQGQTVPGFDFVSDATRARDGDGIDDNPDDPGDLALGGSSSFHGTHVAGTVAARTDNGLGVAGVAWDDAVIMPVRVLGVDGGTSFDVIQGVRFAAGLSNNSNTLPAQRADVINLSLGGGGSSQSEQNTFTEVRNAGVIVVASAGNDASNLPSYPASYDGVISVSATTITKTLAPYSNFGSGVDVAAPGGNGATDLNGDGIGDGVVSSIGDDGNAGPIVFGYAALNGTSMAAPHVAGVAALMKSVHPGLTAVQFETALAAGDLTDDLGNPGRDDSFGHGLINAQKAVVAALALANGSGTVTGPVLVGSPSSVNFGAFDNTFDVVASNAGGGSLSVNQVTTDQPWLTVQTLSVDADGLGSYRLVVDRTGLADGTYSAAVTFASSANNFTVSAVMQVSSLDLVADAGFHYVVLVDAATNDTQFTVTATATNGVYNFSIADVPPGSYRIFAGTDSDNDNFLCDSGEACGSYKTIDSPDTILVNDADVTNVNFISGFRTNLFNLASLASGNKQRISIRKTTLSKSSDGKTP